MEIKNLKPLERLALDHVRKAKGAGWYSLERMLPFWIEDFPKEDRNSLHILRRLEELGLIMSSGPEKSGNKKYVITESGLNALLEMGFRPNQQREP